MKIPPFGKVKWPKFDNKKWIYMARYRLSKVHLYRRIHAIKYLISFPIVDTFPSSKQTPKVFLRDQ